jgi:hypothetical protein
MLHTSMAVTWPSRLDGFSPAFNSGVKPLASEIT